MGETDGERKVGAEWARYIEWAEHQPGMDVSKLARAAKVARSSVYRWKDALKPDAKKPTRVKVESATAIARAVGDDPQNALRAAADLLLSSGEEDELAAFARSLGLDLADRNVREILDGGWTDDFAKRLLREEKRQADEDAERRRERIRIAKDLLQGGGEDGGMDSAAR